MTTPAGVFLEAGLGGENSRRSFLGSRSGGRKSLQAFSGKQVKGGLAEEKLLQEFSWKPAWGKKTPAGVSSEAGLEEEKACRLFLVSRSKQVWQKKNSCRSFPRSRWKQVWRMTTPAGVFLEAGLGEENSRRSFLGSRSGGRKSLQAFSGKQVKAGLAEEKTPAGVFLEAGLGEENSCG